MSVALTWGTNTFVLPFQFETGLPDDGMLTPGCTQRIIIISKAPQACVPVFSVPW